MLIIYGLRRNPKTGKQETITVNRFNDSDIEECFRLVSDLLETTKNVELWVSVWDGDAIRTQLYKGDTKQIKNRRINYTDLYSSWLNWLK